MRRFRWPRQKSRRPIKRMRYALIIGINYTRTPELRLRGCINDAIHMRNYLVNQWQYEPQNIVMMNDNRPGQYYPTRANILRQIDALVKRVKAGDRVFVHYSGHGSNVKDLDGDEEDGRDETIYSADGKHITDDVLNKRLARALPQGSFCFCLFDCCHSGTGLDLRYNFVDRSRKRGPRRPLFPGGRYRTRQWQLLQRRRVGRRHINPCDIVMISGCRDDQTSADAYIGGKYQGAMTNAFLKTMRANLNRCTFQKLLKDMTGELKAGNYEQRPQCSTGRRPRLIGRAVF